MSGIRRVVGAATVLLALVVGLAACGDPDPDPGPLAKHGTGELRRDLEPLVKRWPVLASATSARWMSGTRGDDAAPGPSTYWIDAVVTLDATTLATLAATPGLAPATEEPPVVPGLAAELPDGELVAGSALDAVFRVGDWGATAYLSPTTGQVVLVALGE